MAQQHRTSGQSVSQGNGLQGILYLRAQPHPVMTDVVTGIDRSELFLVGHPDRRKAVFDRQLQNQLYITSIMLLLARFRCTNLCGVPYLATAVANTIRTGGQPNPAKVSLLCTTSVCGGVWRKMIYHEDWSQRHLRKVIFFACVSIKTLENPSRKSRPRSPSTLSS